MKATSLIGLTVIPDGKHALDYLFSLRDDDLQPDREPDLILLDLNLPGLDGCQVLEADQERPLSPDDSGGNIDDVQS